MVDLVDAPPSTSTALPPETLAGIEIVVGGWGCNVLDDALLARMPKLQLLAYAAGSVKHTVTPATWQHGVFVSSAAAANAVPVAEFTFAAIVMIAKDVFRTRDRHREVARSRSGDGRRADGRARHAGSARRGDRRVGDRPSRHRTPAEPRREHRGLRPVPRRRRRAHARRRRSWSSTTSSRWADIVTVHAPALPSTHHLVNAERLARMHDGAWLLNTARGSLVDTDALTRECVAGRLNAFVDTPDPEPLPADSPLYDLPNVVLTPHIAGSLGNEISRMGDLAVAEVRRFLAGEPLLHQVRAEDLERIA